MLEKISVFFVLFFCTFLGGCSTLNVDEIRNRASGEITSDHRGADSEMHSEIKMNYKLWRF